MKKKMLSLALMTIFISLMALGSAAYFTVEGRATNVITTGEVVLTLDEHLAEGDWTEVKEGDVTVAYHFNDLVMPGVTVDKNPTVTNSGTQPFWLRAQVVVSVESADGQPMSSEYVQLLAQDETVWTAREEDDGWDYYTAIVTPGQEIALFDGVKLAEETPNEYQSSRVTITVRAQAVQSKNNDSGTVLEIQGWPMDEQQ